MKKSLIKLGALSVLCVGLSAQSTMAAEGFTSANDAVYRGHNEGFHGFEFNNARLLVAKSMTNLDQGSKNFPNFGAVINFALKQKMTLKANISCTKTPCEVKVIKGTQVIQGPVNVTFNPGDLTAISNAMKTARPNEGGRGEGRRQQPRDEAPIPGESR